MENKQNFMGIIIPVVVAVILLTVLPIINNMNVECPPCEECPTCEVCPSYNVGQLNINPDFSSGNYNIDKGDYDYIDSATIIKDENLIPENIKKDVDIFGVVGTLENQDKKYIIVHVPSGNPTYQKGIHFWDGYWEYDMPYQTPDDDNYLGFVDLGETKTFEIKSGYISCSDAITVTLIKNYDCTPVESSDNSCFMFNNENVQVAYLEIQDVD